MKIVSAVRKKRSERGLKKSRTGSVGGPASLPVCGDCVDWGGGTSQVGGGSK